MAKVLITGNEALAESCLRAGCRFFSGYPITPQSAILEYLSWRMDELGGKMGLSIRVQREDIFQSMHRI